MDQRLPQGNETILVVDDEESLLAATARILEGLGYRVMEAETADKALALAASQPFDLLIMDVVLPRISGLSLAHKITTLRPEVPVLFTSAYASQDVLDNQLAERPGVGFLQKPFTAGQLGRAVREILDTLYLVVQEAGQAPDGSESVLVVDDDPQTHRFLTRTLERLGYHVLGARDPGQALAFASNSRIDLAILELELPGTTAPELARAMAERAPGTRFLFISGELGGTPSWERDVGTPEAGLLVKPFTSSELGQSVREVLDG